MGNQKTLTTLNGVRVVAADDAKILFHDKDGVLSQSVSLPIGRHDLSRYNVLLDDHFTLQNIKVVSQGNAAETMTYLLKQMLKTSANQDYIPPMEGTGPVERRYAQQIQQRIARNRELRDEDARQQRIHRSKAEKILADRENEEEEERNRKELMRKRKQQKQIDKELSDNDDIDDSFEAEPQNPDGTDKYSPKVVSITDAKKKGEQGESNPND